MTYIYNEILKCVIPRRNEKKKKHNQDKRRAEYLMTFDSDFNTRPGTDHKINE